MPRHPARFLNLLVISASVIIVAACSEEPKSGSNKRPTAEKGRLSIYVVNYPLQYFAERVGGDNVEVVFPAPADVDPAFWMPDAETVVAYQSSDLIVLNGANYAKWVGRVSLPQAKLVDTSKSFKDQYILIQGGVTHAHGPGGEHSHAGSAFTTWLDPKLAMEQARAITQAFVRLRPDQRRVFQDGFAALERGLLDLNKKMTNIVSTNPERPLLASHPVYQYLTRRYGLNVRSVHWEPDQAPNDAMWKELTDVLPTHPAKWMIWEGPPTAETVQKLKDLGVESIVFSPCSNVPREGDYLSVMQQNVSNLARVFSQ